MRQRSKYTRFREWCICFVHCMNDLQSSCGKGMEIPQSPCTQVCGDTGVVVDAKTYRDSIFRAAADAAANCAAEQNNQLGGQAPGRFLSGIAHDLGEKGQLHPHTCAHLALQSAICCLKGYLQRHK